MSDLPASGLSLYNLVRPEILADPYPLYHRLRSTDPVRWDAEMNSWVLTRYRDVTAILVDARVSARRIGAPVETLDPISRALSRQMLFQDPPDHTRLRKLVTKSFTPRMVDRKRASPLRRSSA